MPDLTEIPTETAHPPSVSGIRTPSNNEFDLVITDFPELLIPRFTPTDANKHGVEHHIVTTGPPLHARARRLDTDKLAAAKAEFTKMEQLGIIWRSSSPWASPLHMVKKPGVVSGSSTPDSSTPDSSTIYTLQLLIASHKQFRGGSGGGAPQF